jgi:hypothetical protein
MKAWKQMETQNTREFQELSVKTYRQRFCSSASLAGREFGSVGGDVRVASSRR